MKTKNHFESFTVLAHIGLLLILALLQTACTSPMAGNTTGTAPLPAGTAQTDTPQPTRAPPPMSSPLPAREVRAPVTVTTHCKTSADCAVKNVGNCCGMQPACVNKDSPTDPAAVQAQCNAKGMMGICGFKEISACQCDNGQCVDATPAQGDLRGPSLPIETH